MSFPSAGLVAVLALGISTGGAAPGAANTVIRGEVRYPRSVPEVAADERRSRVRVDPADIVVYLTATGQPGGRRLGGRPRRHDIELSDGRFSPRVLPVMTGSRVRFRGRDRAYHRVLGATESGRVELATIAPGERAEVRFGTPGIVNLFCEVHAKAAGFVVVVPSWFFTRVAASGKYALPAIPRGSYVVHAWHPRLGAIRRPVTVTGHGILALNLEF